MKRIMLDCINIKNLFGRFNYNIDLRNGEDISILFAPNGCGKTTIFSIIAFMFKPTLYRFRKVACIPFDKCECVLSNGKKLVLKSKEIEYEGLKRFTSYSDEIVFADQEAFYSGTNSEMFSRRISFSIDGETVNYSKEMEKHFAQLDPAIISMFADIDYSEISFRGISRHFRAEFKQVEQFTTGIIEKLKKKECYIDVNFITADRLHMYSGTLRKYRFRDGRFYEMPIEMDDPILKAQKKTLFLYNKIREDHFNLQTKVSNELPKQYLNIATPLWDFDVFEKKWTKYVADIEKYYEIGLLDSSETILNVDELEHYYEEKGAFLSVYLAAFSETLKPLEEYYEKFKLFVDIFNEKNRITNKTIKYDKNGIMLKVDNTELSLDHLSSGEKNDFVMFYDLIFNSPDKGLVLIDEPEISQHIEWQHVFLKYLIHICELNGIQSIIATHSPNIMHGHRELLAERGIEYAPK